MTPPKKLEVSKIVKNRRVPGDQKDQGLAFGSFLSPIEPTLYLLQGKVHMKSRRKWHLEARRTPGTWSSRFSSHGTAVWGRQSHLHPKGSLIF